MTDYPQRGPMFAIRYLRWLCDSGATMEIGPDAFAVLTAVVTVEDELHYGRAPNFFNEQLAARCGIGSIPALIRARTVAVAAGLLVYEPGAKRRPGRYFVFGFCNDSLPKAKRKRNETDTLHTQYPIPNTPSKSRAFQPPSIEEVKAYCQERGSSVDPVRFFEYFQTGGWRDSKGQAVKNWKQKLITWESNSSNGKAARNTEIPDTPPRQAERGAPRI